MSTNGSTNGVHHGASSTDADLDTLYAWMPGLTPAPAPCPEALCSLNVHLMLEGVQVQLTLRGHEELAVLARLKTVLAQYPQRQAEESQQSQDVCPLHHVPMQRNTKNGRSWLSHRTPQGWCKGGAR